jgi:hypothetical protein
MADQHIIVMMIPHQDAAITMADLALSRSQHSELKALAQCIKTSQHQDQPAARPASSKTMPSCAAGIGCGIALSRPIGLGMGCAWPGQGAGGAWGNGDGTRQ